MTKLRPPLSIDAALTRIVDRLPGGWREAAEETQRSEGYLRNCGDPDKREQLTMRDAVVLDRRYRAVGGLGAPLFEYFADRLDAAGALDLASGPALMRVAATLARECGQANAALLEATGPGATPAQLAAARREIDEAIVVLRRAKTMLVGRNAYPILAEVAQAEPP